MPENLINIGEEAVNFIYEKSPAIIAKVYLKIFLWGFVLGTIFNSILVFVFLV